MKKYDVFKSQGGYGVALGIHLDSPVMGAIRWFEAKSDAEKYAESRRSYDRDYAKWEEKVLCVSLESEVKKLKPPKEKDYDGLDKGVTI